MKDFKKLWDITKNWQLIFPALGLLGLGYSSFRLASLFLKNQHIGFNIALTIALFFLLLKLVLFIFKKLESKWNVTYRWELISIFLVFAFTGSSSVYIGKPIIKLLGITKENLSGFAYWALYIFVGFIFYQILLIAFGWIFGQYNFFWGFEKKMLRRFGFKKLLD